MSLETTEYDLLNRTAGKWSENGDNPNMYNFYLNNFTINSSTSVTFGAGSIFYLANRFTRVISNERIDFFTPSGSVLYLFLKYNNSTKETILELTGIDKSQNNDPEVDSWYEVFRVYTTAGQDVNLTAKNIIWNGAVGSYVSASLEGNYYFPDNKFALTTLDGSGVQLVGLDEETKTKKFMELFIGVSGYGQLRGWSQSDPNGSPVIDLQMLENISYNGKQLLQENSFGPVDYILWSGISWMNDGQEISLNMQGFQYSDFYEFHLVFAGYVTGGSTIAGKTHTHILPFTPTDIPDVFEFYGNTYISIPKNLSGESGTITKGLSFSATGNTVVGKTDGTDESNEWALVGIRARRLEILN